ncbi:MAG: hypothetical protein HEQ39_10940 [Rhizobacter sp.]
MTTTQLKSATAPPLLADASAIGMGWSKPSGVASDAKVKAYLGQVLHNLTGGKIQSIDRLPDYAAGQRRSQLEASLNKEVASASGGRLSSWRQLLSAGSRELLERQTTSSNPPVKKAATNPFQAIADIQIGNQTLGQRTTHVTNGIGKAMQNTPIPGVGLTPKQVVQGTTNNYNAAARTINQTVRAPVLPVAEPASSFESVRARADSWVARASKGKFDSVADLVHFAGDNKAANRLRGQVTQMLQKDAGAQAGGFSNWKQVLTAAERGQLERTLVETQKLPPTQPNTPKQQQAWAGQALQQVQKLPTPKSERGPLDTLRNVVGGAWDQFAGDTFKAEIEQLKKIVRDPSRLIKPIDDIKNWLESDPKGQWNNAIATWGRVFSHPPEKWAEAYKAELMKQPQTQMLREFSHKVRNDRDFQEQLAGRGLGLIAQVIVTRKVTKALQGNPGSAIQPIKQTPTAVATAGQGGLRLQAIKETLRSLGNEVTPSHVVKKLRQYMIDITDDLKTTPKGTARYKELADIRAQLDQRLNGRLKPTAVVPQPHPTGVNQPTPAIKPAPVSPTPIKSIAATPLQPLQPFAVHPSRVKLDALLEPMLKEAGLGAPSLARSDALRQFEQEVNKIGGADKLTTDKQRRELIQRAIGEATGAQPTTHTQPSKPTQPIKPIDTQPKTQPNNTAKPNLNPQPQPTPGQGQSTPNGSTAGVQGKPTPVIEVERPQTKVPPKAPDWSQLPPEGKLTQPSKGTVPVNTTPVASQEIPLVSPELHRALVKINDLLGPALIAVGLSEFSKERSDAINRVERAIEQAGGAEKLTSDWQRKQLIDQAIGLPAVKQPTVTDTQPNSNSAPTPVTPQQPVKVPNKPTPLFEDSRYGGPSPYIDKVPAGTVGAQRNPNRPEGGNNIPGWNSMTPEQKVQTINRLIQQPITPAQELQIRAGVVPPEIAQRLEQLGIETGGTPPGSESSMRPSQRLPNTPLSADEREYLKDILRSPSRAERYLSGQHGHYVREQSIAQRMTQPLNAEEQQSVMAYLITPTLRERFLDGNNLGPRMTALRERVLQLPKEQAVQPQVATPTPAILNTPQPTPVTPENVTPPWPIVPHGMDYQVEPPLSNTPITNPPLSADERAYLKDILRSPQRAALYLSGQHGHHVRERSIAQRMTQPLNAEEQQSVMAYLTTPALRANFLDGTNLGPRMTALRERVLQLPKEQALQPQVAAPPPVMSSTTPLTPVTPENVTPPWPIVPHGMDYQVEPLSSNTPIITNATTNATTNTAPTAASNDTAQPVQQGRQAALPPSRLPKGVEAIVNNPDGSRRVLISTEDNARVGLPVQRRANGKDYARTGPSVPDGQRVGVPMEKYIDGVPGKPINGQTFGPVVEIPKDQVKQNLPGRLLGNGANALRDKGLDFRLGIGFKAGVQLPGPDLGFFKVLGPLGEPIKNGLGSIGPWLVDSVDKLISLKNIQLGNFASGGVVVGADSVTKPMLNTERFGIGVRGMEAKTQGPNLTRFESPLPLSKATGLQMKVSSLNREVLKAFQGQDSPIVFKREIGAETGVDDWLQIPGKLELNVLPVEPNPASQDVFGVAIRPHTKYYTLQHDLTLDKAMLEHYAKLIPIPINGLPVTFTGERRHETAGKITIEKGAVLPQEFVAVINRPLSDITAVVKVPLRNADKLKFSGDQLADAFQPGPQGQPPRIAYDPEQLTVTFSATGAIRISSVPGKPLFDRRGTVSQDIQNVDFMFYEKGFADRLWQKTGLPNFLPQSVPGVPSLFTHVSPYGADGKLRFKLTPGLDALKLGFGKIELSAFGVRDARKVSPAVQDSRPATITFKVEQRQPSGRPGEMTTRWVDASIDVPGWMGHLFARDINTLPVGARDSIKGFLAQQKKVASPEQLQAITSFEANVLPTFKDNAPLKIAARDGLGELLKALALPKIGPGSADDRELTRLLQRQPAPKGVFQVPVPAQNRSVNSGATVVPPPAPGVAGQGSVVKIPETNARLEQRLLGSANLGDASVQRDIAARLVRYDGRVKVSQADVVLAAHALRERVRAQLPASDTAALRGFRSMTDAEIYLLEKYTEAYARVMDASMRQDFTAKSPLFDFTDKAQPGDGVFAQLNAQAADIVSRGLSKLPNYEGTVYRGVEFDSGQSEQLMPGQVVEFAGLSSSSFTRAGANYKSHLLIIESTEGKDVSAVSRYAKQGEVVFNKGARFEVTSREVLPDGRIGVHLRQLPSSP